MTDRTPRYQPRMLLALDAADSGNGRVEHAAKIATNIGAELVGLFFENPDLITAAALPATSLISRHDPSERNLDVTLMKRALRVQARRAEANLARIAERAHTQWSFQIIQGTETEHALLESRGGDILTFIRRHHKFSRQGRDDMEPVLNRVDCSIFLLNDAPVKNPNIVVLYQGNATALDFATRLADVYRGHLDIFVLGQSSDDAFELEKTAKQFLHNSPINTQLHTSTLGELDELSESITALNPQFLLIDDRDNLSARLFPDEKHDRDNRSTFLIR